MGPDDGCVLACMYRGRSAVLFDESNHPVVFSEYELQDYTSEYGATKNTAERGANSTGLRWT